jgi:hypothetical protein
MPAADHEQGHHPYATSDELDLPYGGTYNIAVSGYLNSPLCSLIPRRPGHVTVFTPSTPHRNPARSYPNPPLSPPRDTTPSLP